MRPKAPISHVAQHKIKQFLQHCTLHGAYYLTGPRWWLRILWLIVVCCCLALCCFLGHMIWDKFVVDPTLTVVETTHYSTADIPFPAVLMCDTETVHMPNTGNITNLLTLRGYNESQVTEFYQSFTNVKKKNYSPPAYVRKMHHLLDDLGLSWEKLLEMFKKPCEEIIVECYWRSQPHNCAEMFRSIQTVMGYCCQFDTPYFKKHAISQTNFIAGVQTTEALDVIVSGSKMAADGNVIDGFVQMYVFDYKDRVTLIDSAILLTSAAYFDVNVYLWAIDSSSYVKDLALHARKCILDSDIGTDASFYQGCLTRLILKKVVDECKCLPFEYSAKQLNVEDYTACTWDRLICIYQEIEKVESDVRDIISLNECYQRCDYVQYETEVELVHSRRNSRNMSNLQSRVTVHFSDTTCMKYRREVLYTWDQMLANLGGIFGLCLGGSIVSILEIIWFILDLLCTIIHKTFTKRKIQPKITEKNRNQVFVINENAPRGAIKLFKIDKKNLHTTNSNTKKLETSGEKAKFKFVN